MLQQFFGEYIIIAYGKILFMIAGVGFILLPFIQGVMAMTVFEALSLMIMFATFVVITLTYLK